MNKSMVLSERSAINRGGFFLLWISSNVAGWLVWIGVATIPSIFSSFAALSYLALFIIGGVTAILQWLLLKRQFLFAWYEWLILTTIGFALGFYRNSRIRWHDIRPGFITRLWGRI